MPIRSIFVLATLTLFGIAPGVASAQQATAPSETIAPAFRHTISNIPGKSIIGVVVHYAPGAKSRPHHHAASAFVTAYVLSGAIRSQVNDEPERVFHAGESWTEAPGAHHRISENASATEPASLLAIFIVDTSDKSLTTFDRGK